MGFLAGSILPMTSMFRFVLNGMVNYHENPSRNLYLQQLKKETYLQKTLRNFKEFLKFQAYRMDITKIIMSRNKTQRKMLSNIQIQKSVYWLPWIQKRICLKLMTVLISSLM